MKIIVPVKTNPDLQMVRIKNRQPVLEAVPYQVGDLDKNAVEAALQLQAAAGDTQVVVLTLAQGNRKIKDEKLATVVQTQPLGPFSQELVNADIERVADHPSRDSWDAALAGRDAHLWILRNNPRAEAFYRKHGFVDDGTEVSCGPMWFHRRMFRMHRRADRYDSS